MSKTSSLFTMDYQIYNINKSKLILLYTNMLKSRMIEDKMLILLRQGKISKWFSGIGQEAISVGVTMALNNYEYILPMHRNLGVFITRAIPLYRLFAQWQGKPSGFTKGRDRSFHFGTQDYKIIGMISHLGPQLGIADGIALASCLKNKREVTVVFTGDGGTSEGDFHEALNIASVWKLPVLFCVENNGYGLSTPINEQYNCKNIADRAIGYGMESYIIDGNNILEVYNQVTKIVNDMRNAPRPVLIEFKTFRMRGHEEASGINYVPEDIIEAWAKKDPIINFESFLKQQGILTKAEEVLIKENILKEINSNLKTVNKEEYAIPNKVNELGDVFKNFMYQEVKPTLKTKNTRFVDAISEALKLSMQYHNDLIIMGQDIAEYGGVFKITDGFVDAFGKNRVRNTPICESGIIETAMGLSIAGIKSVVELQFADFISTGFNPVVNYLAKSHYRWGQHADIVLRMPCGGGIGAGPFHSQTNEAWFTNTPGLKVVYPAFPYDAKGLLNTAINDPNPVLFFEHKGLYRSITQKIPEDYYTLPFGEASQIRTGNDVTIIAYGASVHWALETMNDNSVDGDLIDLRTLQPLDTKTIYNSVKKTGKAIILQEDSLFGGIASDISALIMEHCFEFLDAPVKRVASMDTPIPFESQLEAQYLAKSKFKVALNDLLKY